MRRSQLARRLAALERAKAPPQPLRWSPWQRILSAEEDRFCAVLSGRRPRPRGGDPAGWAALCGDEGERALLAGIVAKAPLGPANYPLASYLDDLAL
jgi:hypothetical protein